MKELLDRITAWFVVAALAIAAVVCIYAGWQGRGWWEKRRAAAVKPPAVAAQPAPVKPGSAPVTSTGKPKYVPPELGVDLTKVKAELEQCQSRERSFIEAWIDACDDSTIAHPPNDIRYDDLYQEWVDKYFAVCGSKPETPQPQLAPTPVQAVNNAIRQYGLGLWPGLTTMVEYRAGLGPETSFGDRINYTLALTCDFAVLHRIRLGAQANIYEAGANVGYHLPGLGTAFRNTYLRGLVNWRYDGGRPGFAPDAAGLGIGTQF